MTDQPTAADRYTYPTTAFEEEPPAPQHEITRIRYALAARSRQIEQLERRLEALEEFAERVELERRFQHFAIPNTDDEPF